MPEINIQQVFADLQDFIRNSTGNYYPNLPVGVSITTSGEMAVKYMGVKVHFVKDIEEAAKIIQDFLNEQKPVQSVTEIKFIKASFHNSDFSAGIRNALKMICADRSVWTNSDEQSVQTTREAILINTAAYAAGMEIMDHGISSNDNIQNFKTYLDRYLEVEFLTEAPKSSDKNVQWVYNVELRSIYSQKSTLLKEV